PGPGGRCPARSVRGLTRQGSPRALPRRADQVASVQQVHLEPDVAAALLEHPPAVRDLTDEVQTPAGGLVEGGDHLPALEARAGIDHLDPDDLLVDRDGEMDLAAPADLGMPDAVRDELADQDAKVVQDP